MGRLERTDRHPRTGRSTGANVPIRPKTGGVQRAGRSRPGGSRWHRRCPCGSVGRDMPRARVPSDAARRGVRSRHEPAPATLCAGPVAQRSEQGAFNPRVVGSNPTRLTTIPRVNVGSAGRQGRGRYPIDSPGDSHVERAPWIRWEPVDRKRRRSRRSQTGKAATWHRHCQARHCSLADKDVVRQFKRPPETRAEPVIGQRQLAHLRVLRRLSINCSVAPSRCVAPSSEIVNRSTSSKKTRLVGMCMRSRPGRAP